MTRILWKKRDAEGEFLDLDDCAKLGCKNHGTALFSRDALAPKLPPALCSLCDDCATTVRRTIPPTENPEHRANGLLSAAIRRKSLHVLTAGTDPPPSRTREDF